MIKKVIKIVEDAKKIVEKPFEVEQKDGFANIVTSAD